MDRNNDRLGDKPLPRERKHTLHVNTCAPTDRRLLCAAVAIPTSEIGPAPSLAEGSGAVPADVVLAAAAAAFSLRRSAAVCAASTSATAARTLPPAPAQDNVSNKIERESGKERHRPSHRPRTRESKRKIKAETINKSREKCILE